MSDVVTQRPWEDLERTVLAGDEAGLEAALERLSPSEAARAVAHLSAEEQRRLFALLDPAEGAQLIEQLADVQAAEMLDQLEPRQAAAILHELPSDDRTDLLGHLEDDEADAILAAMPAEEAQEVRDLAAYPADTAGGLMRTELLAYRDSATVAGVTDDLRRGAEVYADYAVQYLYVVGARRRLRGVVPLRRLLLSRPSKRLSEILIPNPTSVSVTAGLDELEDVFDRHAFVAVPVTDPDGALAGVVRRVAVHEALAERADSDYRKALGIVGGEELRTMPLLRRSRRRLSWLTVNIGLNVVAASVIAFHQETLRSLIALAAMLPIISDMSGCSGNQAVAVSMRELALGTVRPADAWRVAFQELKLGLLNGTALGLLLGGVAALWQQSALFGLVVGGALALNTVLAVLIGGTVPLLLRRLGSDPALASGPILTTVTDLCGFFFALTFADLALSRLAG